MEARSIIALFGGVRPMARTLRHASHTTVQGRRDRNCIPSRHQSDVLRRAWDCGLNVTAEDLILTDESGDGPSA